MRGARVIGAAMLAWTTGWLPGAAISAQVPEPPAAQFAVGMPLRDALEVLRARGFAIVYSDLLVGADLHVDRLPDAALPLLDQARVLLAPFGLALEPGDSLWFVVRGRAPAAEPAQSPAVAEPPAARARAPLLEEVRVVASRYRLVRDLREQRRLEHQELAAIPSTGRDVLRAVGQLPGMASVGVSARNHVRGSDVDEVLYRVEGAPLIEPFHLGEFQALFSIVNPDVVGALDFYSGGFPVSMGSRLGGVVDIEFKDPERPFQGAASVDLIDASVFAEVRRDTVDWLVSVRRSTIDELMHYLHDDYGEPSFHDELLKLRWSGDRAAVTAGLLSSTDELSLRDPGAGEDAGSDFHNVLGWTRLEYVVDDALEFDLLAAVTRVESEREGELDNPADAVGSLRETRNFDVFTLQPSMRLRFDRALELRAGLEAQRQSGDFFVDLRTRYGPLGDPLQPNPEIERMAASNRDGELFAGWVSLQQSIGERLLLEYGLRHDLQDNDPIHDHQTSPRLQVRFAADPTVDLYVNLGRYAQHQNLYELQIDDGLVELQGPQIARQVSAGADWRPLAALALRLEAYRREVDDPWRDFDNLYNRWVLLPELHADRVELRPDAARAAGVEFSLHWQQHAALAWSGSYAYASTEQRLARAWRRRPWDQAHTVRFGVNWRPAGWQVDLLATWHSGWATNARYEVAPADPATFFGERLPDFVSVDLHVARQFRFPRGELELYGDVSNVTFHHNVGGEKFGLSADGALLGRDRQLLDPIPAIGVAWRW